MSKLFNLLLEKEFTVLDKVSYWNGLHIFTFLVICIAYNCLLLIIPQHDVIKEPKYWYELMFIYTSAIPMYGVLGTLQECYIYFGIDSMLTASTSVRLFLASAIGFVVPYCLYYLVWMIWLGYNPPIPFAVLCCYPMVILFCIVLWYESCVELRDDDDDD